MYFILRLLHVSYAANIRAFDCRFRGPEADSPAGCPCLAFDDDDDDDDGIFPSPVLFSLGKYLACRKVLSSCGTD